MNRKIIERLKSLLIVLLSCSALLLVGLANRYYNFNLPFIGRQSEEAEYTADTVSEASRPIKMAVMNEYGRYGAAYDDQTVDELYDRLGRYLGEALGTVSDQMQTDSDGLMAALKQNSIFYQYPGEIPLSALARWLGTGLPESAEDVSADAFALIMGEDEVTLCYRSGGSVYAASCDLRSDVLADIDSCRPNGVSFAFELAETTPAYEKADRFCLVVQRPTMPVITAKTVTAELRNTVVSALGFNPYSDSSYTDADGTEIFTANNAIVSLGPDGLLVYRSGDASHGELTEAERIELARATLASLASPGDAALHFTGETAEGDSRVLTFDYVAGGARIVCGGGSGAAVTILGDSISEIRLYLRNYDITQQYIELLPSLQAAAMGSGSLEIVYTDSGSDSPTAGWVS